jgi:hypothetical protein
MNFDETAEFQKELKSFAKKWRTLPADLKKAKRLINLLYTPITDVDIDTYRENFFGTKRATIITKNEHYEVVKMRLDCAALGNKSMLRLVFVYVKTAAGVILVELYAKNEKSREDVGRIKKYLR